MGVSFGENGLSTRPGRIDTVIEVGYMTTENKMQMAQRILCDWPDEIQRLVHKEGDFTPAQFQELCIQVAFNKVG